MPLALRAVEVGFDVVAFDIDTARIECLRMGKSYIDDITDSDLDAAIDTGRYLPTEDSEALTGFDVAVICMPTPLREGLPDVSYIEAAAIVVAPHIRSGACVILESTTYPGTTEDLLTPILEAGSGLRAGTQFFVGYSPERIDPGNQLWRLHNTPKIVAGSTNRPCALSGSSTTGLSNEPFRWPPSGRPNLPSCWRTPFDM